MIAFTLMDLAVFLGLHWVGSMLFGRRGPGFILGASAAAFFIGRHLSAQENLSIFCAVAIHLFFLILYLHFYVGVDRSVSLRIMNEIAQTPGGRLSQMQLESVYPASEMFRHRVEDMVKFGWLKQAASGLEITGKSKILVYPTIWFRKLYGLKETF